MFISTQRRLGVAVLMLSTAVFVHGAPVTVPAGLNPGDQYRLVFITSDTRDATSSSIGDYNNFVTAQANLSPALQTLNTTWRAIASTAATSAFNNIGGAFTAAVYNLQGQLIANGSADLWDNSLDNPILYAQDGNLPSNDLVFTATTGAGNGSATTLGSPSVVVGSSERSNLTWVQLETRSYMENHRFYAISDVLTVPQSVPEPGTIGLLALGLAGLCWRQRVRLPRL